MARITALIKLAIVVAIVSSSISYFQINTHLADMFGTEDLRHSTIQFLGSVRSQLDLCLQHIMEGELGIVPVDQDVCMIDTVHRREAQR